MVKGNRLVVLSGNVSWYVYNFRMPIINALIDAGFSVTVIAVDDGYSAKLREAGCGFVPISLNGQSVNPVSELKSVYAYWRVYKELKPFAILHYTPKPNIYGSIAAKLIGVPCVNNIAGLGSVFVRRGILSVVVKVLYRLSQTDAHRVFFQNRDDMKMFIDSRLVRDDQAELLPGSGVELEKYRPSPKEQSDKVKFLFVGRLIWDKGVGEFASAARIIKARFPQVEFELLGYVDSNNPTAIPVEQIRQWENEGLLRWVGRQYDVRPYIEGADCVVLPSYYREGTPRSLLEAASMAKPIIAADSVGCREPVEDGVTGFLAHPKDHEHLAARMEQIILMGHEARLKMGELGRKKMEEEYDARLVAARYLGALKLLPGNAKWSGGGAPSPTASSCKVPRK